MNIIEAIDSIKLEMTKVARSKAWPDSKAIAYISGQYVPVLKKDESYTILRLKDENVFSVEDVNSEWEVLDAIIEKPQYKNNSFESLVKSLQEDIETISPETVDSELFDIAERSGEAYSELRAFVQTKINSMPPEEKINYIKNVFGSNVHPEEELVQLAKDVPDKEPKPISNVPGCIKREIDDLRREQYRVATEVCGEFLEEIYGQLHRSFPFLKMPEKLKMMMQYRDKRGSEKPKRAKKVISILRKNKGGIS